MAKQRFSIVYRIKNIAIYTLVIVIGFIVRQLPRRASLRLGTAIGDLVYRSVKRRRQIALSNLKMALGGEKNEEELRRIARRSFHNMGKTLIEFLSFPGYSEERLQDLARVEGIEKVHQAMAKGKGVIIVSAHLGNWEIIFQIISKPLAPFSAVAQSFKYHRLDRLVNSYRTRGGGLIIKKEEAVKQNLRRLRQGLAVSMLGDQDAGDNGVFIDFFGVPASTTRGPVMLALRTGASIINLLDVRQSDDSHLITFSAPVEFELTGDRERDIQINTARVAKYLEKVIRKYPCQWLWMHNRWKTRPGAKHPASDIRHPASSILVLSDGKPGHYNQSLGIMDRMRDAPVKIVQVRFKRKWRDNMLRISTRLIAGIELPRDLIKTMLKWAMESSSAEAVLGAGHFDAILSTGSSVAAPNLLLGQLTDAKTAVCTRPSPVGIRHFDLAILPEHNLRSGHRSRRKPLRREENVVATLGVPNRVTPEYVRKAGVDLASSLSGMGQHRVIGVLLGGDDPHYSIPPDMANSLCDVLLDICEGMGTRLALTTSRRTDPRSENITRSRMQGNSLCPFLVLASEPQAGNPVPGILGISDITIVTEDSFSMVCEAASSGRKIIILEVDRKKRGHLKRQRVYQLLIEQGYAKSADLSNLKSVVLNLMNGSETSRVLDDAQTAADALRKLTSGIGNG